MSLTKSLYNYKNEVDLFVYHLVFHVIPKLNTFLLLRLIILTTKNFEKVKFYFNKWKS